MTYPYSADWNKVPEHMQDGLRRYLDHGIEPGGFMIAVLSNDLRESFARADAINRERLFDIVCFLYADAPALCWGSPARVKEWINHRGLSGIEK